MDDAATIQAVLTGDKQRYSELIERYKRMVYAIAWSRLGDAELAEDASQETFVRAYQYLATLRQRSHFDSWLGRIARNVSTSLGKKRVRERNVAQELAQLSVTTGEESSHRHDALWSCLAELPTTHREALTLFYVQNKSIAEAAEQLGIAEPAMKVRLHRARLALRDRLETSLEESLKELEPSGRFTGSVMALLPVSPIGVVNTAGFYAVLAKLGASLSFLLWLAVIQIAATGVLFWLTTRGMQSEFKDEPENLFRRKAVMGIFGPMFILITVVMCFFALGFPYALARFGTNGLFQALSLVYIPTVFLLIRRFKVNRTKESWFILWAIVLMLAVNTVIGFAHAPSWLEMPGAVGMMILMSVAGRSTPLRSDYNLFLRAATDGFGTCDTSAEMPPHLSDIQFQEFARFLGSQSLIADYQVGNDGMALWLVKPGIPGPLGLHLGKGFDIAIDRAGTVVAKIRSRTTEAIGKITGRSVDNTALNASTAQAVQDALRCFVNGNRDGARAVLTAKPDKEIFNTKQGRTLKVLCIVACVPMVIALVCTYIAHTHVSSKDTVSMGRPSILSGMPFMGTSFLGESVPTEWFMPSYPSMPLLLKTTLIIDPAVNRVDISGLSIRDRYSVASTQKTVTIARGGTIIAAHGMISFKRTPGGFVTYQR